MEGIERIYYEAWRMVESGSRLGQRDRSIGEDKMGFKKVRGLKKSYASKFTSEHKKGLSNRSGVKENVRSGSDFGKRKSSKRK